MLRELYSASPEEFELIVSDDHGGRAVDVVCPAAPRLEGLLPLRQRQSEGRFAEIHHGSEWKFNLPLRALRGPDHQESLERHDTRDSPEQNLPFSLEHQRFMMAHVCVSLSLPSAPIQSRSRAQRMSLPRGVKMSLQTSTLVALSMLLVMGGCATPEEYAQAEANHMSSLRALCEGYGYAPGSEAFARCVQTTNERQQAAYAEQWRRNQCLIDRNCPDMMPKATSAPQYTNCIRDMTGGLHCVTQ